MLKEESLFQDIDTVANPWILLVGSLLTGSRYSTTRILWADLCKLVFIRSLYFSPCLFLDDSSLSIP
jgi:hypothetical protein